MEKNDEFQRRYVEAVKSGNVAWKKPSRRQSQLLRAAGGQTAPAGYHPEVEVGHVRRNG